MKARRQKIKYVNFTQQTLDNASSQKPLEYRIHTIGLVTEITDMKIPI